MKSGTGLPLTRQSGIILSPDRVEGFRREVMEFFRVHGRTFPWRETRDPYAVMVSEFMLQQTQTARVTEKYAAWLERFPTVRSVAQAELSDVLSLWNGLGYNRRAKFLHEACKRICTEYGGIIPDDAETLDALPGIGAYTARAICAFAFGKAEVFVETNIRAVFIHCFFAGEAADGDGGENGGAGGGTGVGRDIGPASPAVSDSDILPLVEQTLDAENPRTWYYALMDYGAHLKKTAANPSRKSASYARQSAFRGSLREARGAILRQLSRQKGGLCLGDIGAGEGIDADRLEKAAAGLLAEGLIRKEGERYSLG